MRNYLFQDKADTDETCSQPVSDNEKLAATKLNEPTPDSDANLNDSAAAPIDPDVRIFLDFVMVKKSLFTPRAD